ncbi:MAG: EF-hand domain-containing protein [Syntrophobacteraceae bacterium]|nr:EF-hand domain-containing protein [Desulfobacteraceae bacterium]
MVGSIGSAAGSSSYIAQMQEKLFKALDTSGDGKIDSDELAAAINGTGSSSSNSAGIISSVDTDSDSAISLLEFESGLSQLQHQMQGGRTGEDSPDEEMFSSIDTNRDGTLSTDELEVFQAGGPKGGASTEEMLARLDTDGSGDVSGSEFAAGMKAMKADAQQGPSPGPPPDSGSEETTVTSASSTTDSTGSTASVSASSSSYNISQLFHIAMQNYMKNLTCQTQDRTIDSVSSYA